MITIGFIGLGHMGNPMAFCLLKAGFAVIVYDIDSSAIHALSEKGAIAGHSVTHTVKNADIIITMLQTGEQVSETCEGSDGIFLNAKKDALYIDMSTIDLIDTRKLHVGARENGLAMLDAPVSGGVSGAEKGSLTFMVGGEEANFLRAKPFLEKMGKKIIYAGSAGHGQAAKICNNLMLGISMIAVSEGFSLADKLGLDKKKFFDIASNASSQCWSMTTYCPVPDLVENTPSNHDYQPGFTAKMMLKDLLLGLRAAESVTASIPLGVVATELYTLFVNEGNGGLDFSAIIKMISTHHSE